MGAKRSAARREIPFLKVKQWLPQWEMVKFDARTWQPKPDPYFYVFSMRAGDLKALTGVYRRSTKGGRPRTKDPNVQRGHEEQRSRTIREFVQFGFPWCEMSVAKRESPDADDLRKPGWLPTTILVNILEPGAQRDGKRIPNHDLVRVEERDGNSVLVLPEEFSGPGWEPEEIYPLEVIDGQHRLWAFEGFDPGPEFELPVAAFHGLGRSWQAYLFWSINITPKRINRSLAFDLYPLLRRETWLDKFAGHSIYRETRCQELVESLWSHPESPWCQRINMLGETAQQRGSDVAMVSQAAWIRSLMATFVKEWSTGGERIGGLFGAPRSKHEPLLPWNRAMQAAFLIFAGRAITQSIARCTASWAVQLRSIPQQSLFEPKDDPAFYGKYSLLTTDQGIRGILSVVNDLCYLESASLGLEKWRWEDMQDVGKGKEATDEETVSAAVRSLQRTPVARYIAKLGDCLCGYDWRTSSTPNLPEEQRLKQSVFRGSSGYRELRRQLLEHLAHGKGTVADTAIKAMNTLSYK
jgi:hypothetical protein